MSRARDVYIIGAGMTQLFRKAPMPLDELGRQAIFAAVKDAGINFKEIGSVVVGNMGGLSGAICIGQRIACSLGLGGVPMINVESACSSGAMAVNKAAEHVADGTCDIALAVGVEHLSSVRAGGTAFAPDSRDPEGLQGATMPGIYAMRTRRYMHEFGATLEDMALVAVKNRRHAMNNPYSSFRTPITVEEVVNARMVSDPLTLLMSCPNADGGAAVVVATKEVAEKLGKKMVKIAASHITSGIFKNSFRDFTEMEITIRGAKESYEEAGLGPDDISMVECHDAFVIGEVLYLEAMGFCGHGEAIPFLKSGQSDYGGKVVFSPRGGLLSCGHPTGCSGTAQIVEATWQLRGEAGDRQVPGCKAALTHVTGGGVYGLDNAACTIHILTN
ncbi:MAG TPA: propanoyl-CoA acyltransferase [Desulfotomaculum sp.]|nr:MAG: Propanoyl-CoA C-acyltransferase [Desulfotomaculum sp. 46_80]HAG10360.1 propanoyl-CoA acyltransferase [Desulfotomaculum sp.]HBY04149.1 propanoyl-CoA acyltransferase [Desulfotomaculum sp.]